MSERGLATLLGASLCLGSVSPAVAQFQLLSGYLQTVPVYNSSTELQESNLTSFSRFRLSSEPVFGAFSINAAYEHAVAFRWRDLTGGSVGVVPSGGEWLNLQWAPSSSEHIRWQHRFDRLAVGWRPTRAVDLSVGRQAVSWGTTLFLTPADPFSPFSPADPFREFRAGVDAARVRISPSALSEIDVVVRATETAVGEETTALARGLMTVNNWEISGWGGSLYGDAAGAVAAAGAFGAWAVRGETVVRQLDGATKLRGTIGVDRLFQIKRRDTLVLVEYQHDQMGAAGPDEYRDIVRSAPFARGEFQVIGRDETVLQASVQVHPLWSIAGLWLWNLNDRSALLSPTVAYSLSDEASVAGGILVGVGDDESTVDRPLPSEYGLLGVTAYLSATWYF